MEHGVADAPPAALRRPGTGASRGVGTASGRAGAACAAAATLLAVAACPSCVPSDGPTAAGPGRDLPARVAGPVALVGVHVVPMDRDTVLRDRTVVIRDARIDRIGPSDEVEPAGDVERIDARGLHLLPGLIDAHVHLRAGDADAYLAAGVTTVRNMWGTPEVAELRRSVEAGERLGPGIVTASPGLDGDPPARPESRVVTDPDRAGAVVGEMVEAGWDYLKIYQNLSPAVYRAVVAEARRRGIPPVGHVPTGVPLDEALGGQLSIEHLEGYDKELTGSRRPAFAAWSLVGDGDRPAMDRLAAATRDAGAWNCPTLLVADRVAANNLSPEAHADAVRARRRMVLALHEAGAPIVAGTDGGVPVVPPGSLAEELLELELAGLTPYEALRAATAAPAEMLGLAHEIGSVAEGLRADLVLLRRDPLADLRAVAEPLGVVVAGQWVRADRVGLVSAGATEVVGR